MGNRRAGNGPTRKNYRPILATRKTERKFLEKNFADKKRDRVRCARALDAL